MTCVGGSVVQRRLRTLFPEIESFIFASHGVGFHLSSPVVSITIGCLSRPVLAEGNQAEFPKKRLNFQPFFLPTRFHKVVGNNQWLIKTKQN